MRGWRKLLAPTPKERVDESDPLGTGFVHVANQAASDQVAKGVERILVPDESLQRGFDSVDIEGAAFGPNLLPGVR